MNLGVNPIFQDLIHKPTKSSLDVYAAPSGALDLRKVLAYNAHLDTLTNGSGIAGWPNFLEPLCLLALGAPLDDLW
jgi:hypothetical protein